MAFNTFGKHIRMYAKLWKKQTRLLQKHKTPPTTKNCPKWHHCWDWESASPEAYLSLAFITLFNLLIKHTHSSQFILPGSVTSRLSLTIFLFQSNNLLNPDSPQFSQLLYNPHNIHSLLAVFLFSPLFQIILIKPKYITTALLTAGPHCLSSFLTTKPSTEFCGQSRASASPKKYASPRSTLHLLPLTTSILPPTFSIIFLVLNPPPYSQMLSMAFQ